VAGGDLEVVTNTDLLLNQVAGVMIMIIVCNLINKNTVFIFLGGPSY